MEEQIIYPRPLKKHDRVCIIDPANAFTEEGIAGARRLLEAEEFDVVFSEDMAYKRGTPKERAERLNRVLADDKNRGIFCLWGGYGSMTLLEYLDYGALARNRPVFSGLSDITAMHLAIQKYAHLATFHSPPLYGRSVPASREAVGRFLKRAMDPEREETLQNPDGSALLAIRGGDCEGRLTGGNLTLVSRLMGTPYEVDTRGKILFLEEVGEKPYRLHGMLTQLRLAGKLDEAAGILLGSFTNCDLQDRPGSAMEAVLDVMKETHVPVIGGLLAGHVSDALTLPMGMPCRFQNGKVIV